MELKEIKKRKEDNLLKIEKASTLMEKLCSKVEMLEKKLKKEGLIFDSNNFHWNFSRFRERELIRKQLFNLPMSLDDQDKIYWESFVPWAESMERIKTLEAKNITLMQNIEKLNRLEQKELQKQLATNGLPKIIIEFLEGYKKLLFNSIIESHDNSEEDLFRYRTLEEIKKYVEQHISDMGVQISYRVNAKCGKIIDASDLYISINGQLNGKIVGEKGTAKVETITAGGYNIQVLHYRVLVK